MEKIKLSHIGIIMDGNRRWAKKKNLPTSAGHKAGVDTLEKIVKEAVKQGINYLTVYALSTENIKEREKQEVKELFGLIKEGFVKKLSVLKKESVKVTFFGNLKTLPKLTQKILKETENNLREGKRVQLNIAINYGARDEIVRALNNLQDKKITEEEINKNLDSATIPDPDLIIRTGGQKRLSNFLLWQAAYSELYFTDVLWPDFDEKEFRKAILDFEKRKRNFGR